MCVSNWHTEISGVVVISGGSQRRKHFIITLIYYLFVGVQYERRAHLWHSDSKQTGGSSGRGCKLRNLERKQERRRASSSRFFSSLLLLDRRCSAAFPIIIRLKARIHFLSDVCSNFLCRVFGSSGFTCHDSLIRDGLIFTASRGHVGVDCRWRCFDRSPDVAPLSADYRSS